MVVQSHIAQDRRIQVLLAVKSMRLQDVFNTAIEALDYAIGLWRSGLGQTVLYAQRLTQPVKLMIAAGLALPVGKQPVGELLAVVRQDATDPDRTGFGQGIEKGSGTGRRLVWLDLHEHPTRGPVNGHEQIASFTLAWHLRQVLHINVHKARFIVLEGLVRLLGCGWQQITQLTYTMASKTAVQARAGDIGADELMGDRQQVIQRQQQRAAQLNNNRLLRWVQSGLQPMGRVRAIGEHPALLPFVHRLLGDAVAGGQHRGRFTALCNLTAHRWRGAGVLVQDDHHGWTPGVCKDSLSCLSTARAMNRGRLLLSMESSGMRHLGNLTWTSPGEQAFGTALVQKGVAVLHTACLTQACLPAGPDGIRGRGSHLHIGLVCPISLSECPCPGLVF